MRNKQKETDFSTQFLKEKANVWCTELKFSLFAYLVNVKYNELQLYFFMTLGLCRDMA